MTAPQPLRNSRFSFYQPALLLARATLFTDALTLTGWRIRGRYDRRIPFDRILQTDVAADDTLLLWLASGETLRIRLADARAWKRSIEAHKKCLNQE